MKKYLLSLLLCAVPATASAGVLSVNSPSVTKGEASLEGGIGWERDPNRTQDHFREYIIEGSYGFTDYWNSGVELAAEREAGEGTRYAVTKWKNTFEFYRQSEKLPVTIGMRLEYKFAHISKSADEIAAQLLLRHKGEHVDARVNIGGQKEVGAYSTPGVSGDLRASVRYLLNDHLSPALDYLGDTGSLHESHRFHKQDHRIGPVLYGKLREGVDYQIGYLAGISDKAPDHSFKFEVEYTF